MNEKGFSGAGIEVPQLKEFEKLYQQLCTQTSEIEYLTSEIYNSINKIKPLSYPPSCATPVEEKVEGILAMFFERVSLMNNTITRLQEIDNTLKQLV